MLLFIYIIMLNYVINVIYFFHQDQILKLKLFRIFLIKMFHIYCDKLNWNIFN